VTNDPDIPDHLRAAIEAILLAADSPVSAEDVRETVQRVDGTPIAPGWIEASLSHLQSDMDERAGGFRLVEVGGGWEFRTRASLSAYVHEMYQRPATKLSRAALEVLAVVAYRQPCTRADIEEIRGVDCSRTLRALLDKSLLRILGKTDDVGRPMLYGTSPEFLTFFGLTSLTELPTLREYTELTQEHMVKVQALEETLQANLGDMSAATDEDVLVLDAIPPVGTSTAEPSEPEPEPQPDESSESEHSAEPKRDACTPDPLQDVAPEATMASADSAQPPNDSFDAPGARTSPSDEREPDEP
jgi:segregation and condensation protein B